MYVLLQLTPIQQSVKDQFTHGGSPRDTLLLVAAIIAVIPMVYALSRFRDYLNKPRILDDPQRLFRDLLAALPLDAGQRRLLSTVATDLSLPHPITLLLSPRLFDRGIARWRRDKKETSKPSGADPLQTIHATLFPSD